MMTVRIRPPTFRATTPRADLILVGLDAADGSEMPRLAGRLALLRDGGCAQVLEQVGLPGQDPGQDLPGHR